MDTLFEVRNFHLMGRHILVALKGRQRPILSHPQPKRDSVFGHGLDLPHGYLALRSISGPAPNDDMADFVGERVHDDPADFSDFTVRTSNF